MTFSIASSKGLGHAPWLAGLLFLAGTCDLHGGEKDSPAPTREFEIKDDRPFLGGKRVDLWGIRCGNALMSWAVTERHIRCFDNFIEHGINLIGVYIQGS